MYIEEINLLTTTDYVPYILPEMYRFYAQAAAVCFEHNGFMANFKNARKMKKYDELHAKAMVTAQYAFLAQRKGDPIEFVKLSKEAFGLERQAAMLLQHCYDKEPTRSIFFKSAAFLAFDAQEYSECLNMIILTLLGAPDTLINLVSVTFL
jgi:hypothetical protein